MPYVPRSRFTWRLRSKTLPLGRRTLLMGIVNVTPDSFTDGDRFFSVQAATDQALRLLDEGADIVDIGGESTRPNAVSIDPLEEQARVLPAIESILRLRPEAVLSIDTYHSSTARCALQAGVEIVNDVSGLLWDAKMAGLIAESKAGCILMHTRGAPRAWSTLPDLPHADVMPLVLSGLTHSLSLARSAGIAREHIVLDPGFGFGKRGDENFALLASLGELHGLGLPLLVGISRKRFLTAHLAEPTDQARLEATTAANTAAVLGGAHLLRVHDVAAARLAMSTGDALLRARRGAGER